MGIPLDFITRRIESRTQAPTEPATPVVETPQPEAPAQSSQVIYFNSSTMKPKSLSQVASPETNPVNTGDSTESMIKELSDTLGGVDLSSLKKAA